MGWTEGEDYLLHSPTNLILLFHVVLRVEALQIEMLDQMPFLKDDGKGCYEIREEHQKIFYIIKYNEKENKNAYLKTKIFVHQLYSHHVKTSFLRLAFHMDGPECPVA